MRHYIDPRGVPCGLEGKDPTFEVMTNPNLVECPVCVHELGARAAAKVPDLCPECGRTITTDNPRCDCDGCVECCPYLHGEQLDLAFAGGRS